jgi:hypothetical protein
MFGLASEKYPAFGSTAYVEQASETSPAYLSCVVSREYLTEIDIYARESTGSTIYELAGEDPREAYLRFEHLFAEKFAKLFVDQSWEVGSPEQDGIHAYEGLERYVRERRVPNPDIDEIDVVISVWKRGGIIDRIKRRPYILEEALRFCVEPQNLSAC